METKKCVICEAELSWGGFAYEQEMCWDCFIFETKTMLERIDHYPSYYWAKRNLHRGILKWMVSAVAEIYGLNAQN